MQRVRKTFFDPLATSKAQIREKLQGLPVGSAHPFSPEQILLLRTENGIDEIDISSYPEDFFFNAVDLGEMGEILLRRMAGFRSHLAVFEDFQIMQAPASTFKVPIVSGQITILAVSERTPTYYDFCFADASCNACCWLARNTFRGINHSGDILNGQDLLDYVKITKETLTDKEICVFISGYQKTQITRFLGTHPALMVADHVDKVLYIVPVPLDTATIGDATICCPLVIKRDRDGESLICSILPTATTDRRMMCYSDTLRSPCFPEAIRRADFTISSQPTVSESVPMSSPVKQEINFSSEILHSILAKDSAVISTHATTLPLLLDSGKSQMIRFGTGLEFQLEDHEVAREHELSSVVLPCIFGSQLEGPVLLATGTVPSNVPFVNEGSLLEYYRQLKHLVVVVDDRMTDNARNIATPYRINALFIIQLKPQEIPATADGVLSLLNSANINAVTALAGPQSLVLVQISDKFYFYRGIANRIHLNTSKLAFGSDVTSILESVGARSMLDPRIERTVKLGDASATILLPASGQFVQPQHLQKLFQELPVDQVRDLDEEISAAVPQLQMLLNPKEIQELSGALVAALSAKIANVVAPLRDGYIKFLTKKHDRDDAESNEKKNELLGRLRKSTKEMQKALEPAISSLANMMSSQATSKRTHDLKRLARQAQIQGNVEATKSMNFETLAGYLETYAGNMGVMLLNIETVPYRQLLSNLESAVVDARVLHLEGFDAGIIIEQSQNHHSGPLQSQAGPSHPTLALPYLSPSRGAGSMLAWVCWDEFVNLKSPYTVRWMEKCNEAHIAALRIMMRDTLAKAVASREHNMQPSNPETGRLMSALLMAAMSKLAAMRTTKPVLSDEAEDTVTRLMRGLFGNLLTIAGSGVRPLSMVWQLFGLNPQYDVPTSPAEWIWYKTVVALYPYTGWPLEQFHNNLEKLLDKAIIRVVTKSEEMKTIKASRTKEMIKFCKLRNIQLDHSRTIITIFMRMLLEEDNFDIAAVSSRLLEQLPPKLERQTQSYTRMLQYLRHLATGGERRVEDDLIAANVYTQRSAAFAELKTKVSEACKNMDWAEVKQSCQELLDKHEEIAALYRVPAERLKIQNVGAYKGLLGDDYGADDLTRQVLGDAEKSRVPWQVGKKGQFGDDIEPLDETFIHEMLTGEKLGTTSEAAAIASGVPASTTTPAETNTTVATTADDFELFKSSVQPDFIATMQKNLSAEDVCRIVKIPVDSMRTFINALNPNFAWEELGGNFKRVVLELLRHRSNRVESCPTKKLLVIESRQLRITMAGAVGQGEGE